MVHEFDGQKFLLNLIDTPVSKFINSLRSQYESVGILFDTILHQLKAKFIVNACKDCPVAESTVQCLSLAIERSRHSFAACFYASCVKKGCNDDLGC